MAELSNETKSIIMMAIIASKDFYVFTPEQQLDHVLNYYHRKKFQYDDINKDIHINGEEYVKQYNALDISTQELMPEILEKLCEDKCLKKLDNDYTITFKGLYYCANQGYQGRKNRRNIEKDRIREQDRQIRYLTYVMAFGAAVAAIYYMFEFLKWYYGY